MPVHFPGLGGLATFFVYIVQPLFESLVGKLYGWNAHLPLVLAVTFTVLFLVDCAFSVRIARSLGNKLEQMEKLGELIKAHLEGAGVAGPPRMWN